MLVRCLGPLALIVLATTWPLSKYQDHPHWDEVEWIPFTHYFGPFDLVANVALFVPFGIALGWGGTTARRVRWALALGLACSLTVELAQVFSHNRSATVADLVTNSAGAWLGAHWAVRRQSARSALAAQDRDELRAS
jgi:glycopeptide antibiotics resistance protein